MTNVFLVILGAAIGAPTRHLIDEYVRKFTKKPYGIFAINIVGSFLIGLTYGKSEHVHDLIAVGFAGAFTTWSTFMLDIYISFERKRYTRASLNLIMSLSFGLLAAWLGMQLG